MNKGKTIAVIGAGTMGVGIAVQYAMCGHPVALYSRSEATLERARKTIAKNCELMEQEALASPEAIREIPALIRTTTSVEDAVDGAWYVVESIAEDPEQKRALYGKLDAMLPEDTVLSSNTSYLDMFSLLPERRQPYAAIVHWFAPAFIMPLVEIVRGPATLDSVIDRMKQLHDGCGKTTVCMDRFVPGFLVNRLQIAMKREVMYLLDNGYCTAEDIDLAVKTSLMPRGMLLGLVQRMDFGGLSTTSGSYDTCPSAPNPPEDNTLSRLVAQGRTGVKSGGGFYDYTHAPYEEILHHRDVQLIRSVRLAQEFMADPLHDTKK